MYLSYVSGCVQYQNTYVHSLPLCDHNLDEILSQKPPLRLNCYIQVKYLIWIRTSCVAIQNQPEFWVNQYDWISTPPKFNIAPETGYSKGKAVFPPSCFTGYLSFRWSKCVKAIDAWMKEQIGIPAGWLQCNRSKKISVQTNYPKNPDPSLE